jgi:hypothetical protein
LLERARQQVADGHQRKAIGALWGPEAQDQAKKDPVAASALIDLVSELREQSSGRIRKQFDLLLENAQANLTIAKYDSADLAERQRRSHVLGAIAVVSHCRVLGGAGLPPRVGETWNVVFTQTEMRLVDAELHETTVPYDEVTAIEIGGPGATRTGGGFFGGGFGLQGAAEGMLVASALNLLTTRTSIDTILCLQTKTAELFLLNHDETPNALRMRLSPVLTILRQREQARAEPLPRPDAPATVVDQLAKLSELLDRGLIDEDEFRKLKGQILG